MKKPVNSSLQGDASHKEYQQNYVGECGGEIYNLKRKRHTRAFYNISTSKCIFLYFLIARRGVQLGHNFSQNLLELLQFTASTICGGSAHSTKTIFSNSVSNNTMWIR